MNKVVKEDPFSEALDSAGLFLNLKSELKINNEFILWRQDNVFSCAQHKIYHTLPCQKKRAFMGKRLAKFRFRRVSLGENENLNISMIYK